MEQQAWKAKIYEQLREAKSASSILATASTDQKNSALLAMANNIWQSKYRILAENEKDIEDAQTNQIDTKVDRLRLTEKRLLDMTEGLRQVASLDDPVGEVCEQAVRPNGLVIRKVRVPFGVIAIIYESRPNVTADAASLAVKTGNSVVLRGGKEALRSNLAITQALQEGLSSVGLDGRAIQFISWTDRESVDILVQARGFVDLVIPRGGAGLINRVVQTALVPVIETGVGNCHVYVDGTANEQMATEIVVNSKTARPSVCNAAETLLVHRDFATSWLPDCVSRLLNLGVQVRACPDSYKILNQRFSSHLSVGEKVALVLAQDEDWSTEFLNLTLAVKLVDSVDDAIAHIGKYGTKHSEAIVAENTAVSEKFLASVDASVVYHNASTRFTDGYEFGFGSEIGISTQKLHARGPMGLRELTSYKYVVHGTGQVR